ncbi:MAG: alpha/beta hydrolase [Snowella sp.]|nr:alpha/beta hydrolase [Snowella sp.]
MRSKPLSLTSVSVLPENGLPPQHLLVLLHGWGADANDLSPLASILNLPTYQCLFPNAPFPHPQFSWGRAWYALERQDYRGLAECRQMLQAWLLSLEAETGIPLERTILGGFSQGAAMALDVGLGLPVAGLCSLSGYLHFQPQHLPSSPPPIFMVHGQQDMVVPIQAAHQARNELKAIAAQVEYHELAMGHEIPQLVLQLLKTFIENHTVSV